LHPFVAVAAWVGSRTPPFYLFFEFFLCCGVGFGALEVEITSVSISF
jgi:hypothetical protein